MNPSMNTFRTKFNKKRLHLKERISFYTVSMLFLLLSPLSNAAPTTLGGGCSASADMTDVTFTEPSPSTFDAFFPITDAFLHAGEGDASTYRHCHYPTQPTSAPDTMCNILTTESEGTNYLATVNLANNTYCLYQYDINLSASSVRSNPGIASLGMPPVEPRNVPVFSPLGLLATMFGLLWFGKRRRKSK